MKVSVPTRRALAVACTTAALGAAGAGTAAALVLPPSPAAPRNTSRPVVKGSLVQGATLTADRGTWTGTPPPTFTYQWHRCSTTCISIPGASARSYRLGAADVSRQMQVVVTGKNLLGSSSATSVRTGLVRSAFRIPDALGKPGPVLGPPGRLKRLRVRIVIEGRLTPAGARFTSVAVRTVRGARIHVRCRAEGCPYRRASRRVRTKKRLRLRSLERSLPAGVVIELRVTKRRTIGRFIRVRIRSNRIPTRIDRCLKPGARKPTRCR